MCLALPVASAPCLTPSQPHTASTQPSPLLTMRMRISFLPNSRVNTLLRVKPISSPSTKRNKAKDPVCLIS